MGRASVGLQETVESCSREQETILAGEYAEVCGQRSGDLRKQRRIRRIEEYEKFLTNCQIVREKMELEKEIRLKEKVKRRNTVVERTKSSPEYILTIRSKSLSYLDVIPAEESRVERFSLPPLAGYHNSTELGLD